MGPEVPESEDGGIQQDKAGGRNTSPPCAKLARRAELLDFQLRRWSHKFLGGPVARILHSQRRGPGFDPWSGN